MITKLRIQNFKCLRDVSVELTPFTVLIGKNDTGKSSLLEAIRTLGGLVSHPMRLPAIGVDKLVWGGADPAQLGWTVEVAATSRNGLPEKAQYELGISPSASAIGSVLIESESLRIGQVSTGYATGLNQQYLAYSTGDGAKKEIATNGTTTAVSIVGGLDARPTTKSFARSLAASEIYRLEPERLAEPSAFDASEQEPKLGSDGRGLALVLDHILGTNRAAFDAIEQELCAAVPYVRSIRLKSARVRTPSGGTAPGKALFFELRAGGFEIPASVASQGVLLFLAYLALAHVGSPPSILLVEEPENGIHPRQLQRVAEYLKRLADPVRGKDAVQIVTATHSPYFLDFVPPEDVLVFGRKDSGETVIRPLLSLPGVKERLTSGFSLGEMWFNVGEDRLLAEALS